MGAKARYVGYWISLCVAQLFANAGSLWMDFARNHLPFVISHFSVILSALRSAFLLPEKAGAGNLCCGQTRTRSCSLHLLVLPLCLNKLASCVSHRLRARLFIHFMQHMHLLSLLNGSFSWGMLRIFCPPLAVRE